MADENILPRDQNHVTTAGFENSLVAGDVRPGQIIVATGRVKVDSSGDGSGTVTEIDTGTGLTGGPITTTGTISLDTKLAPMDSLAGNALKVLRVNAGETAVEYATPTSGTVTSVSGTANRITSTGGTTPVIDISASYVGQTSITTLGTVTTGTLSTGAVVAGVTRTLGSDATGDIYYRSAGGVLTRLGIGSSTNVLTVAAGLPSWAAAPAASLVVGTTTITSGTNTRILYDNSGVLGEYTLTGTGTVVVMQTGASLITPALGVATATSLAIGGATIGSNGLAVTGHVLVEGVTSTGATGTGKFVFDGTPTLVTPILGVATATSINKVAITAPATSATLTIADGKTLTASDTTILATNAITLGGGEVITFSASNALSLLTTGSTSMTFPAATDTVVTLAASQTLTSKTLTSPTIQTSPVLAAATNLKFTVPTADPSATGITTNEFNSGYSSTAIGDLVYLDSSATWQKADADASAATYSSMLGIALSVAASGAAATVLLQGFVYAATPFPTFTIGAPIYMSATAGAVTQTAPTTTDSATRIIGYGVHADKMYFNPSNDWITHT